jgi:hypothetical protein
MTCSVVYARAANVSLPLKIDKSDVIAKVEVLSTTQVPGYRTTSVVALRPNRRAYRSQAEVKVIQSIKGLKAGEIYTLEFDNGLVCPNVEYQKGDQCLVFNTKLPNGHYETFNTYYGKYMVKENKVVAWKQNAHQAITFDEVVNEITRIMQTPKQPD